MPPPERKNLDIAGLKPINVDGVRSVYSNNVGLAGTPWDIRLIFSEVIVEGEQARAELKASIVMSLTHAKALLEALSTTLGEMEKNATDAASTAKPQ